MTEQNSSSNVVTSKLFPHRFNRLHFLLKMKYQVKELACKDSVLETN